MVNVERGFRLIITLFLLDFSPSFEIEYEHPTFVFEKKYRLLLNASDPHQYVNSSKFLSGHQTAHRPEKFDVIIMIGPKIGSRKKF